MHAVLITCITLHPFQISNYKMIGAQKFKNGSRDPMTPTRSSL